MSAFADGGHKLIGDNAQYNGEGRGGGGVAATLVGYFGLCEFRSRHAVSCTVDYGTIECYSRQSPVNVVESAHLGGS